MGFKEDMFAAACGLLALVYLLNPSAGIVELIPDNVPIIGNLDEAAATALLLSSLRHFNIDVVNMLQRILGLIGLSAGSRSRDCPAQD